MDEVEFAGLEPLEEEGAGLDVGGEDGGNAGDEGKGAGGEDQAGRQDQDPEKEEYSAKVQKRINKLTWEAKSAKEERDRLAVENESLRQKQNAIDEAEAEKKVAGIKGEIKAALDEGDFDKMVDLQDQLATTRVEMAEKKKAAPEKPATARQEDEEPIHESADAWLKRNPWYFENPIAQAVAIDVEAKLRESGMEMGEELYQELDRRMEAVGYRQKAAKKDEGQGEIDDPPPAASRGRAPVAGATKGGEGKPAATTKRLTQADLQTMSKYGFNPNNPKDRQAWLDRNTDL